MVGCSHRNVQGQLNLMAFRMRWFHHPASFAILPEWTATYDQLLPGALGQYESCPQHKQWVGHLLIPAFERGIYF